MTESLFNDDGTVDMDAVDRLPELSRSQRKQTDEFFRTAGRGQLPAYVPPTTAGQSSEAPALAMLPLAQTSESGPNRNQRLVWLASAAALLLGLVVGVGSLGNGDDVGNAANPPTPSTEAQTIPSTSPVSSSSTSAPTTSEQTAADSSTTAIVGTTTPGVRTSQVTATPPVASSSSSTSTTTGVSTLPSSTTATTSTSTSTATTTPVTAPPVTTPPTTAPPITTTTASTTTTTTPPQARLLGGFAPTAWCQSIGGTGFSNEQQRADSFSCVFDVNGQTELRPMDQDAACRWAFSDPNAYIVYPDGPGGFMESPKCWTTS